MTTKPPMLPAAMTNPRFYTGALIGGALAYVLTNEQVQRSIIVGAARGWMAIKGGIEETKERFRDAESEIKAERDA